MKSIAKTQNYKQALYLQIQIERANKNSASDYEYERHLKIEKLLAQKRKQQDIEIEATRVKINAGLNELNLHREKEIEKLYNKTEFMQKNLKGMQIQEKNNMVKDTMLVNINTSMMGKTGKYESEGYRSSARRSPFKGTTGN